MFEGNQAWFQSPGLLECLHRITLRDKAVGVFFFVLDVRE